MLNSTVPRGQHDQAAEGRRPTAATYAIDFINLEQVAPRANPDPARYKVPAGFTHQDVQNALDAVRMDTTGTCSVSTCPAGTYRHGQKFQVYGKAVQVVGAGIWYTRFQTPQGQENTDAGFDVQTSANGSSFEHLAFFGNYTSRHRRAGQGLGRAAEHRQPDHRQRLGRAHGLLPTGACATATSPSRTAGSATPSPTRSTSPTAPRTT